MKFPKSKKIKENSAYLGYIICFLRHNCDILVIRVICLNTMKKLCFVYTAKFPKPHPLPSLLVFEKPSDPPTIKTPYIL